METASNMRQTGNSAVSLSEKVFERGGDLTSACLISTAESPTHSKGTKSKIPCETQLSDAPSRRSGGLAASSVDTWPPNTNGNGGSRQPHTDIMYVTVRHSAVDHSE